MKILVVEDELTSRLVLQEICKTYGYSHVAVNGEEAIEAFKHALAIQEPYNLICLDIMMPEMDGQQVLEEIRKLEAGNSIIPSECVKIIMTTSLDDNNSIIKAFRNQCDGYLVKPLQKVKLEEYLKDFGLWR